MDQAYKAKLKWMRALKVGDVVNNCEGRNLKILTIKERRYDRFQILPFHWTWVPEWLDTMIQWASRKIFGQAIFDKHLVLEDGDAETGCSAMNCCEQGE